MKAGFFDKKTWRQVCKRIVDECFCQSPASFAQLFRQGLDKNLTPQTACGFRAFGNSFVAYMVLWEQVLTPIYAPNEWEAIASLENRNR